MTYAEPVIWNCEWLEKFGLTVDTLPSSGMYQVECDKILAEGYIAIITGEKPVDYFDEMVTAWYNAGGKTLTEEANAIYHAN